MDIAAFLKRADWLESERVRGYAAIMALVSLALLIASYVDAMGPEGTDFLAFWGAGHVTAAGDPALAYDLATQERVQTATGSQGWFAFVNPPPFLFITAPFGALPFPLAWGLWVAVTFALWAFASIRAFPRCWLLVLAYPGALIAAGHAQTGLLTGALLVGAVALLDKRPIASGALIGALIIKPHLALLLPFWLVAGGRWKAFIAAGASATCLLLLSWAVFGTQTMLAYTTSWQASAALMAGNDPDFFLRMATPFSQLRLTMPAGLALAISVAIVLGLIALVLASWRRFGTDPLASGSLVLAASALASPYLFNYDLPFLILPTLWLTREGLVRGFRDWEKSVLVLLYLAPYATRAAAFPMGVNLMPAASLLLLAMVWTRIRKDT
ncbi:glycosyltransferase family 87 protein [Aurantiacibacter flavus]|uniref:Glycosyltransferase family 87 protein n=1 Tax=Aurantiacibacter flavus TaxID=3145232 RepID=A0ABV0CY19_9SPHN